MNIDLKFIRTRVKRLRKTASELKLEYKKSRVPILEDLYLEIECYSNEIEGRIKQLERRKLWQKPKKKK